MDLHTLRQLTGFDADSFIKKMKDQIGVGRVRVFFDNPSSQAMSKHMGNEGDEVLEVHLPTLTTILSQKPNLTREEGIAKLKAAVAEELCHGKFKETDHNSQVVGCTLSAMEGGLKPRELNFPYIQDKITRLKQASEVFKGTPIKNAR